MEQISLDFDSIPAKTKIPTVKREVQEWAHHIIQGNAYQFLQDFTIGRIKYQCKVSSRIKEWAYTFDEKERKITRLVINVTDGKREYRFDVWIANYSIIDWSIEAERYHDETLWDRVGNIHFSAIKKLDSHHGWAKFLNRNGENIQSFDYFKYLFGGTSPSGSLLPIIRNVILNIREKHNNTEGK